MLLFFFFKQKTAYEMRISDWSSDVCSSDLLTWSATRMLISDGLNFFNDKNAMTADPTDSRFVYAVWDRLLAPPGDGGPTWFARTTDGGANWEPARPIYDPGPGNQTIGNVIAVQPDGTLINLFTQIDELPGG